MVLKLSNMQTAKKRFSDGRRYIWFRNGTEKDIKADGSSFVKFSNGDTKKMDAKTGTVVYFYCTTKTTHTTYADGLELFEFPNQQKENIFPTDQKKSSLMMERKNTSILMDSN